MNIPQINQPKKIGILTSGGDCPGLNAVVRAVLRCATHKGWDVYGIPYGTDGLINVWEGVYQASDLKLKKHGYDIPGFLQGLDILQFLSGSILGSLSKGNPNQPEVATKILQGYRQLELDALIVVGGDGSLDIIYDLAQAGQWNLIVIPKTIDNDVPFTERSIGFDTAVNTVTNALYDLTFTAASHDRVMVVQVMGRDSGHLALHAGLAGGADVILIPELVPSLGDPVVDQICRHIAQLRRDGRKFALTVIAEGVKNPTDQKEKYIGDYLATAIQEHSQTLCQTGQSEFCHMDQVDTRSTVLGHIQRSGAPSSSDRLLAAAFGKMAIDLIDDENYNRLIVWVNGRVQSRLLTEVVPLVRQSHQQNVCSNPIQPYDMMVRVAQSLGVYIGPEGLLPSKDAISQEESQGVELISASVL
jgi:6-phosphofructokinase 1